MQEEHTVEGNQHWRLPKCQTDPTVRAGLLRTRPATCSSAAGMPRGTGGLEDVFPALGSSHVEPCRPGSCPLATHFLDTWASPQTHTASSSGSRLSCLKPSRLAISHMQSLGPPAPSSSKESGCLKLHCRLTEAAGDNAKPQRQPKAEG